MEASFATDFSSVRVHHGDHATELGARAYAQGEHVHFAPGQYDPESVHGQELLGHELAHVVQQRAGGVATPQGKGGEGEAIHRDPGLEAEADHAGAQAARGEQVAPLSRAPTGDIQRALVYSNDFLTNDTLMTADQVFAMVMAIAKNEFYTAISGDAYGPGTLLYLSTFEGGAGAAFGRTLMFLMLPEGKAKPLDLMTDPDWQLVNRETGIQIFLQINVDKLGTPSQVTPGAQQGKNEVLNTLIHEFTLHAEPCRSVIEAIRTQVLTGVALGASLKAQIAPGGALDGEAQHAQLVAGTNPSHTAAVAAGEYALGLIDGKESWNLGRFQRDVALDRHTETIHYVRHTLDKWKAFLPPRLDALAGNPMLLGEVEAEVDQFLQFIDGSTGSLQTILLHYEHAPGKARIERVVNTLIATLAEDRQGAARRFAILKDPVGHAFDQYLQYAARPSRDPGVHWRTLDGFAKQLAPHRARNEAAYEQLVSDLDEAEGDYMDYQEYVRD